MTLGQRAYGSRLVQDPPRLDALQELARNQGSELENCKFHGERMEDDPSRKTHRANGTGKDYPIVFVVGWLSDGSPVSRLEHDYSGNLLQFLP